MNFFAWDKMHRNKRVLEFVADEEGAPWRYYDLINDKTMGEILEGPPEGYENNFAVLLMAPWDVCIEGVGQKYMERLAISGNIRYFLSVLPDTK